MSLFEYPVTRPIRFGRWGQTLLWLITILYIILITLINVVSVGYDYVQVISSTYNATQKLWYERLPLAKSFVASSLICTPAQISWNEGTISETQISVRWKLTSVKLLQLNGTSFHTRYNGPQYQETTPFLNWPWCRQP